MDTLLVKVKDGGWVNCIKNVKISADIDLRYFAIVCNNQKSSTRTLVSNIDIESIAFYNSDGDAFQDQKALKAEALELSAKNKTTT